MKLVSVIIPVYNVSAYIERCIHSVMNQSYTNLECILVDDYGTDDSVAKCEKTIAAYDGPIRFKMIHHEQNRGLSAVRNTGTDAATGDYILYVDSDDEITSDCIEKLMSPILNDDSIEMVMGNAEWIYKASVSQSPQVSKHGNEDLRDNAIIRHFFFDRKCIEKAAWNKLISRKFIKNHGLSFKEGVLWEDTLWMFYVMKHLSHLYLIKDVTYLYTKRRGSITASTDIDVERYHRGIIYNEISNNFTSGDSNKEAKFYLRTFCFYYIDSPHNALYKKTARNFMSQLSFFHDNKERILLFFTGILSKTRLGRKGYHGLYNIYRDVRRLKIFRTI